MTSKKRFLWIFSIYVFSSAVLSWSGAEAQREVRDKLTEAHQNYSQEDYSRCKDILIYLAESFPNNPRFSYFEFMIAKCEYHLKNYDAAYRRFENFTTDFPESHFIPACYFMLGNINYLWGKKLESAQNFVLAFQKAEGSELRELAAQSIEPLLEDRLSERELHRLAQGNKDMKLAPRIFFWLGKREFESKNYREAKEALSYYRDNFPDGADIEEVSLLLKQFFPASQTLKVGVLAPVTGEYSSYAESMINGINLALRYSFMQTEVELVVRDTEGDSAKAASLSNQLAEEGAISIVGPLKSESTLGAAVTAGKTQIPLVSPTASQQGIGALSRFVFQLSPSNQTKGRSLAELAIQEKGLVDFVLFVSDDEGAGELARGFREQAKKLGATILISERFSQETSDFIPTLRKIKRVLLEKPVAGYVSQEEESFVSEIPVKVDGFFIIAGGDQMLKILPQISFLKISTTVIGTEGSGSGEVLNLASNLNQELIFTSDTYHLRDDQTWRSFLALYRDNYKEEPDRVAALSFDAMNLLVSIFEKEITDPEKIADSLARTREFKGASGSIWFDQYGENSGIPVFSYRAGNVERLR
jgi:branched-chain amino acid transport system substrate-binding protein